MNWSHIDMLVLVSQAQCGWLHRKRCGPWKQQHLWRFALGSQHQNPPALLNMNEPHSLLSLRPAGLLEHFWQDLVFQDQRNLSQSLALLWMLVLQHCKRKQIILSLFPGSVNLPVVAEFQNQFIVKWCRKIREGFFAFCCCLLFF